MKPPKSMMIDKLIGDDYQNQFTQRFQNFGDGENVIEFNNEYHFFNSKYITEITSDSDFSSLIQYKKLSGEVRLVAIYKSERKAWLGTLLLPIKTIPVIREKQVQGAVFFQDDDNTFMDRSPLLKESISRVWRLDRSSLSDLWTITHVPSKKIIGKVMNADSVFSFISNFNRNVSK